MPIKAKQLISMTAPVTIEAAAKVEGEESGPAAFTAIFYTGGAMDINGWDQPVVIDLAGLMPGNVLVANQYHDATRPVGNFAVANDGKSLVANGTATAATAARDEVVNSAANGYQWQASLEVVPARGGVETVKKGEKIKVNGQDFEGPLYITRKGTLKGFAFVTHGADDNTSAAIAAIAAAHKEKTMEPKLKAFIEEMGFDAESLSDTQLAGMKAAFEGKEVKAAPKGTLDAIMAEKKAEQERKEQIIEIAASMAETNPHNNDAIKELAQTAIDAKWGIDKFKMELMYAAIPNNAGGVYIHTPDRGAKLTNRVLEAAICVSGGLKDVEKQFKDEELQVAHDRFRNGIGLKELIIVAAEANGYRNRAGYNIDREVQAAAFGINSPRSQYAAGFSTFSLPNTLAATSNKFLREGWNAVDQTLLRISAVRSVRDFKTITTVSLTGGFQFEKLTADGEIPHATPSELTYSNKADTYGIMFAVTRQDYINDDLGALSVIPRKIGRGGMLKLNDIGWAEFLNNGSFFTSGNSNVNTGVADMTSGGLAATESIFMSQTDADGKPLGATPQLLLVPTALNSAARTLMSSQALVGGSATVPGGNIWAGRFQVESTPYLHNSAYTGYSAAAWYMLANPSDIPVLEIVALNGRVEPVVESADTDFNTLGFQMRGYSDVGVNLQEYRGGVRADGGAS
jgi:hypothetical protein